MILRQKFNYFEVKHHRGKPYLFAKLNKVTAHISWSDGTLFDERLFNKLIDNELDNKIHALWEESRQTLSTKSVYCGGGSSGSMYFVTPALAMNIYRLVTKCFLNTLKAMERSGNIGKSPLEWSA